MLCGALRRRWRTVLAAEGSGIGERLELFELEKRVESDIDEKKEYEWLVADEVDRLEGRGKNLEGVPGVEGPYVSQSLPPPPDDELPALASSELLLDLGLDSRRYESDLRLVISALPRY